MKNYLYLLFLICFFQSCSDDSIEDIHATDKNLPLIQRMNKYTESVMKREYLWADEVRNRQLSYDITPNSFLSQMMYREKDKWSYLDENYSDPQANVDGYDNEFGYHLTLYSYQNTQAPGAIIAQVNYVYPNSPAAQAGLKRGDLIMKNNGEFILYPDNYINLYQASSLRLQLAELIVNSPSDITLKAKNEIYTLTSQYIPINPLLIHKVLTVNNIPIGYIHYTEFVNNNKNSLQQISDAIRELKTAGIRELILDLRYNQGGYLVAARHFCSLLAPARNVEKGDLLITKHWNKELQSSSGQEEYFDKGVLSDNLNLSRLYVITGTHTASASELLISGLEAYMDQIILIGEKTVGKFVASISFRPNDDELKKYVLHPAVFAYRNALGESVEGGLSPDYSLQEDLTNPGILGDIDEPLLKATLNIINGQTPSALLTSSKPVFFYPIMTPHERRKELLLTDIPK